MPYNHTSLGDMRDELASNLNDVGLVFWTNVAPYKELDMYLFEALRTWSALTGAWRERGQFATAQDTIFYDLAAKLPDLMGYNVTVLDLVAMIQFHLMEPATGNSWTGTEQFTLQQVIDAIQNRVNRFLSETGRVITRLVPAVGAQPPNGRVAIDDRIIDVRRVAWKDGAGAYTTLWREDEWGIQSFSPFAGQTPSTPSVYSRIAPPPLTLQLSPPPENAGALELLVVMTGTPLDVLAATKLGIPDDLAWVVKWGALSDLMALERGDPAREKYCEQRWQQGIQLASLVPTVVQAQVDGVGVNIVSVADLDADSPSWQNQASGTPSLLAMAGPNLLAVSAKPDAGPHSITLDVVRNAPIPKDDATQMQLGREETDAITDYAFHLAAFKQGGDQFAGSMGNLDAMIRMAALNNSKLRTQSVFFDALGDLAIREERFRPRREAEADTTQGEPQQ
jgi:hypothetical protein